jgi:SAM-dependent methyltransferase
MASVGEDVRNAQRSLWNEYAPGWEKWDDVVASSLGPVGEEMIARLAVAPTQQHLDVAAGTGEPGLTIASIATQGRVVLTDLSSGMLAAARRAADARGVTNVEVRECSSDDLPFDDASFDSVSCRFGFMFFPDLARSLREMARVLRPGGRVCASVWAEPEVNVWATIPGAAIATEVESPAPDLDAPGMFRCAPPGAMTGLFASAGLHDVEEWEVAIELHVESPQQYWQLLTEVTAPVVVVLKTVDAAARERISGYVMAAAAEYTVDGHTRLPGTARCVIGTK